MPQKISKNIPSSPVSRGLIVEKLNVLISLYKTRHDRHYKDSYFHFWADMLLAGVLIALVSTLAWLLIWQPHPEFMLEARLASARVLSGTSEELVINFKNDEKYAIQGAALKLDLPKDFIVKAAVPGAIFDANSNTFNLGDLDANAKGELRLQGIIQGEIGERQFIALSVTYQRGQLKKQLLSSIVYTIDGSALELSADIPEATYKGVAFNGIVEVKNAGDAAIENAVLMLPKSDWEISPNEFVFGDGTAKLPKLEAGEIRKIQFEAIPLGDLGEKDFTVESGLMQGEKVIPQSTIRKKISVTEPVLELSANFSETSFEGKEATLQLSLKNNGESDISKLSISFENKRDTMSVSRVSTESTMFSAVNNSIVYSSQLNPGKGEKVSVLLSFDRRGNVLNDYLNPSLAVSYAMDGKEYSYSVAVPRLKINSNLSVNSGGYYYGPQGDQLGIGPIPPKVDIPTTYWIIWEANNLGNDISNFEVSADLPANVVWLEQQSLVAGEISYSPVGRRVLWKVDKLAQTGGNYRASFAVSIVPRSEDIGKTPDLLLNLGFRGTDLYTDAQISKKLANITTNIENDRKAAGKGVVEPLE